MGLFPALLLHHDPGKFTFTTTCGEDNDERTPPFYLRHGTAQHMAIKSEAMASLEVADTDCFFGGEGGDGLHACRSSFFITLHRTIMMDDGEVVLVFLLSCDSSDDGEEEVFSGGIQSAKVEF